MAKKPNKSRGLTRTTEPNLPVPPETYAIAGTIIEPDQLVIIPGRKPAGRGPWSAEPDRLAWQDDATELHCIILRLPSGALSGYVAVPPGHPLYGFAHDAIPQAIAIDAHGGLNYAEPCDQRGPKVLQVCYTAVLSRGQDAAPNHDWWFGFSCNHRDDFVPGREGAHLREEDGRTYRDIGFAFRECTKLARQLADIGSDDEPSSKSNASGTGALPKPNGKGEA